MTIENGQLVWHDFPVPDTPAIARLRQLATRRKKLEGEIDAATEEALRDGEYVEDIAAALDVSRETVRRFRKDRDIPDARDIRAAKGAPRRRPAE